MTDHVKRKNHISMLILNAQNNSLLLGVSNPVETNHMYGAPPLFHNVLKSKLSTTIRPSVHMKDQKVNMDTKLVTLLAEKGLPCIMTGRSIFSRCFILVF